MQTVNIYSPAGYFLRSHAIYNSKTDADATAERVRRIYARRLFQGVKTKGLASGNRNT